MNDLEPTVTPRAIAGQDSPDNTRSLHAPVAESPQNSALPPPVPAPVCEPATPVDRIVIALSTLRSLARLLPVDDAPWSPDGDHAGEPARISRRVILAEAQLALVDAAELGVDAPTLDYYAQAFRELAGGGRLPDPRPLTEERVRELAREETIAHLRAASEAGEALRQKWREVSDAMRAEDTAGATRRG